MKTYSLAPPLTSIVEAIAAAGGRALLVGGWVRDHLLGIDSKDLDFEVFGLELSPSSESFDAMVAFSESVSSLVSSEYRASM